MQIEYKKGDILESDSQALVNAVNCVGIMGAGLAKQFKTKYPNMYKHYKDSCNKGYLSIGKLCCFKEKNKIIINFPTKIHWKNSSQLSFIDKGLDALILAIYKYDIKSISIPMLGCGLGQLKKEDVHSLIINKLSKSLKDKQIIVRIYLKKRLCYEKNIH